ncbi:Lipoprotein signal peptidase [Salinivirga cyanobacteriivorans]|uniref:Lipoprotein signal peptidase n=1 Tax=Salinivirga cyanobacteriivorans TaxID=1307839 RepID=A0A0S2HZ14_9BACT|nr:lipoprotein signal peptidase [Salinivirga cyanobacteriivorans]ALO15369.1 Lipoprotein signal peptidase [Salinivirga cyanobacteriivorans]
MSKKWRVIFLILLVLVVDQALKLLVKSHLMLEEEYPLLGNWLYLHFTENKGMAFGFQFAGVAGKYILSIIRILAVIGIGWLIFAFIKKNIQMSIVFSLALVMAGALGNIIDSAFYGMFFTDSFGRVAETVAMGDGYAPFLQGKVVDMFYVELLNFHIPEWFPLWPKRHVIFFRPVFNVADMAITSGIVYLLLFRRKAFHQAFL